MSPPSPPPLTPRLVGLTGGIATGKSTVSRLLIDAGLPLLDADQIARDVVAPGSEGLAEVAAAFGEGVLLPDGSLDRAALGARVFADPDARQRLNAITHPRIAAETARRTQDLFQRGAPLVVYDAPLLVENHLHHGMDLLLVVAVSPQVQLRRLAARDGLSPEACAQRVAAQLPLAQKIAAADVVIDNDGTPEATRAQVEALLRALPARLWPDQPDADARMRAALAQLS